MLRKNLNRVYLWLLAAVAASLGILTINITPTSSLPLRPPEVVGSGETNHLLWPAHAANTRAQTDTNAVQVSFALTRPEFMVGELVECVCLVKNTSKRKLFFSALPPWCQPEIKVAEAPKGAGLRPSMVRYLRYNGGASQFQLKPGEVKRLPFWLDHLVSFTRPGTYRLQLKYGVSHGYEDKDYEKWSYSCAKQTLTVKCLPMNPEQFQASMRALLEKALHADTHKERSRSHWALSMIAVPDVLPYWKEYLVASDYNLGNDMAHGLADIGGEEAAALLRAVQANAKYEGSRLVAESALRRLQNLTDSRRLAR